MQTHRSVVAVLGLVVLTFHCGGGDDAATSSGSGGAAGSVGAAGASGSAGSAGASAATEFDDLSLKLTGMGVHVANVLEYRVVGNVDNVLRARGFVQPLGAADVTIDVKKVVPRDEKQKYRLDFYADVNSSGGFDGLDSVSTNDHAWRIPELTASAGVVTVAFTHNIDFTDISQYPKGTPAAPVEVGAGVSIKIQKLGALVGKVLDLRVVDTATGHVTLAYRYTAASETTMQATGVIDTARKYSLDVMADGTAMCVPGLDVSVGGVVATFDPSTASPGACQTGP